MGVETMRFSGILTELHETAWAEERDQVEVGWGGGGGVGWKRRRRRRLGGGSARINFFNFFSAADTA
jgi:hypothetical protein